MMVWEFSVNGWMFAPLSDNPLFGVSGETLIECGAKVTYMIVNEGQAYRLFSAMFLHSGLVHLFFNLMVLAFVGRGVEIAHGTIKATFGFVVGAYGGNVLSALFLPQYISVGASGGIFSLLGMALADIILNWKVLFGGGVDKGAILIRTEKDKRNVKWVMFWLLIDILLNVVLGLLPFIDNFCHVGGMIFGMLFGVGTIQRVDFGFFGFTKSCFQKFLTFLMKSWGIIITLALLVFVTTWLFEFSNGYTTVCHGCRYVSCVSMPFWVDINERWWHCDDCMQAYGTATFNEDEGGYFQVDLTCPNGDVVVVAPEQPLWTIEEVRGREERSDERSDSKSITPPSYITNKLPLVFSLLVSPIVTGQRESGGLLQVELRGGGGL